MPGSTKLLAAAALATATFFSASTPAHAFPQITVNRSVASTPLDPADVTAWSNSTQVVLDWDVQRGRRMHEQTVAHIATDGTSLFVRFDAKQSEAVVQSQRTNDVGQGTDDQVWVDLWPTGSAGFQYQFFVTPNGTHYQSSSENTAYAPRWTSYGVLRDGGYAVTMKIPLEVMRGAQSSRSWRIQFGRYIRVTGEQAVWSYDSAQTSPDDPARAGSMQLDPVAVHRSLARITTYVLGEAATPAIGGSTSRSGADVSIPITAGTSLYATFHPDFSNVELDQQTISPSVYPRALVEVRPFFTQGANNFNNFYCNFCNGLLAAYTPIVPTPRDGYAIEGKQGLFSFTSLEALSNQRSDQATGIVYASPDLRWNATVNRMAVDMPGMKDDATLTGAFYTDLKHVTVYANYGNDSGTSVLQGNRAQYYDSGATWTSQSFSAWGGVHRIGKFFNPADGFIAYPDVSGWGMFANKIWTLSSASPLSAVSLGGSVVRNHAGSGALDQTSNKLDVDVLTDKAIDVNITAGSTYLLLGNGFLTPVSQNGIAITYHSGSQTNNPISFDAHGPSATPTTLSFNSGRFGDGRLDTWLRNSTVRVGSRGTLNVDIDDTAQRFLDAKSNVQWFDRIGYTYQLGSESSLGVGLRRVIGDPPKPNGGGNCVGTCSNVSVAYHSRLRQTEFYFAYGDPNALMTAPQIILKAIFYLGGDKGT